MKGKLLSTILLSALLIFNFTYLSDFKTTKAAPKVYEVPVQLWHAENTGRLSMGNNAVTQTALVEETDAGYKYIMEFVPMVFMEMRGHLLEMKVYSGELNTGDLKTADVVQTYQDPNLDNEEDTFPGLLTFTRPTKEEKVGIKVTVDAMNQIMGGDASQNAILRFDWDNAKEVSKDSNIFSKKIAEGYVDASKKDINGNDLPDGTPKDFRLKTIKDYFGKEDSKTLKPGIYNIDVTAEYLNPLTGITADGGTKNVSIGQGMCQGVIAPVVTNNTGSLNEALKNQKSSGERRWAKGQLQRMSDGKLYATVRIHLINWVKRDDTQGPFFKVLHENGEYELVKSKMTSEHIDKVKDSYADYTFEVPREKYSVMIQMFVEPMNRPVRYFVEVNPETIEQGAVDTMVPLKDTRKMIRYGVGAVVIIVVIGGVALYLRKKKNCNKSCSEKGVE